MRNGAPARVPSPAPEPERVTFRSRGGRDICGLLHPPADVPAAGAVLFMPHGAWRAKETLWTLAIPQQAAQEGFSVLELVPAARLAPAYPGALDDAAAALAWLASSRRSRALARGVIGEGTGANLAAALTVQAPHAAPTILLSGIYDVPRLLATPGQALPVDRVREYLGVQFLVRAADPVASPARGALEGAPPTYLACGDRGPWPDQTIAMTGALARANVPVTCSMFAGDERADADVAAAELARALDWLRRTVASPPPRIGDADHPVTLALRA